MTRRFKFVRHLTMPLELLAAPGAQYHLGEPGDEVDIDEERCRQFDRFLRGRVRAGDLIEIQPQPARPSTSAAAPVKE
jgi:hypothetical protein